MCDSATIFAPTTGSRPPATPVDMQRLVGIMLTIQRADEIEIYLGPVSAYGAKRTLPEVRIMSAIEGKADIG